MTPCLEATVIVMEVVAHSQGTNNRRIRISAVAGTAWNWDKYDQVIISGHRFTGMEKLLMLLLPGNIYIDT